MQGVRVQCISSKWDESSSNDTLFVWQRRQQVTEGWRECEELGVGSVGQRLRGKFEKAKLLLHSCWLVVRAVVNLIDCSSSSSSSSIKPHTRCPPTACCLLPTELCIQPRTAIFAAIVLS